MGRKPATLDPAPHFCSQALPGGGPWVHASEAGLAISGSPAAVRSLTSKKLSTQEREVPVPQNEPITPTLQLETRHRATQGNRWTSGKVSVPNSQQHGRVRFRTVDEQGCRDPGTWCPTPMLAAFTSYFCCFQVQPAASRYTLDEKKISLNST